MFFVENKNFLIITSKLKTENRPNLEVSIVVQLFLFEK